MAPPCYLGWEIFSSSNAHWPTGEINCTIGSFDSFINTFHAMVNFNAELVQTKSKFA